MVKKGFTSKNFRLAIVFLRLRLLAEIHLRYHLCLEMQEVMINSYMILFIMVMVVVLAHKLFIRFI